MNKTAISSVALLAAATFWSAPQAAFAQTPPTTPPAATPALSTTSVGEVVVTARLVKENVQNVPLTITAFDAATLAQRGGASLEDIAQLTPAFNYAAYATAAYPVLTIRGEAQRAITNFEENVSTFYGGIYLPRAYMVDAGLAGIQRVEVVEGPQSALYGRNAFAGAVNYVPLTPPNRWTADLFVTGGTDKRFDYGATVGGPIIADRVKVIAGFAHSEFDGTWPNSVPDADAKAGGTTEIWVAGTTIRILPPRI